MFGKVKDIPQTEKTEFNPVSPYGVSKVFAHQITNNYRDAYGIFACNGILFNHESPVRGETFVTQKIVMGLCRVKKNIQKKLYLGNVDAIRDWGHAKDYMDAAWRMMQQKKPENYVIASGIQHSVKEFVNLVLKELKIKYKWKGSGLKSKCYDSNNKCIIECSKVYYRPLEVESLKGDSSKARKKLNWRTKITVSELVKEMVNSEMKKIKF